MIIHFIFIALYFTFNISFSPEYLNAILIIHCATALLLKLNKDKNFITPLTVFFVSTALISIGNINVINKLGTFANKTNAYTSIEDVPEANFIWCIGVSCVFIGYELFSKLSLPSLAIDFDKGRVKTIYQACLLIGIFYPVILSSLSFLGSLLKLFYLAGSIGVMFFARLWTREKNTTYRNYAVILYVVQTYLAFQHAYLRNEIILPTVVFFVGYFIGTGTIKTLVSYRILPFVIAFASFINIFASLGKSRGNFGAVYVQQYLSEAPDEAEAEADVYNYENTEDQGTFLDRSAVIAQISNCVKLVKKNGFYEGNCS